MSRGDELDFNDKVIENSVCKLLGHDVQLIDWEPSPIHWSPSNEVTDGLWQMSGTASRGAGSISWSMVIKTVKPVKSHSDASHYNYWKREVLAYQSGVTDCLPDSVRAPRCLMLEERPEGTVRLWLERIVDVSPGSWSMTHYARAARALGRFNGVYLSGRPLPDYASLSRSWMRSWVTECMKYVGKACLELDTWGNPYLRALTHAKTRQRFERLLHQRDHLITTLECLPRVFCHNDAWRPNLFLPETDARQMAMIDWAFCGIGGVGEELGRFFGLTLHVNDMTQTDATSLMDTLFESYLDGLTYEGWHGDSRVVRFGFAASAALRAVMVIPRLVNLAVNLNAAVVSGHENDNQQLQKIVGFANIAGILLDLADEAYSLSDSDRLRV
ncbi:phosphotransferase [Alicyclobacillus curvatus]|nr:phosphotransferase [Alicyclobacillus curvatus]